LIKLAARGSALARWQAEEVARLLREADGSAEVELVVVETTGDRRQDVPVWEMGGQGVFVKEVQAAVLEGRADAAVHSAKDLPSRAAPGLVLAAFPTRADPRDALVGSTLAGLGPGARVATGSVRRRAQLAWARPDLTFVGLRGNIATRLDRRPLNGAVVVAMAALERLGLAVRASEVLDVSVMIPQVGQGALAVECRAGDQATIEALAAIDDTDTRVCVETERAFLARLGGGCDLPVGAYAVARPAGVEVEGLLASRDGRVVLRAARVGSSTSVGADLAESLLASGGSDLMADGFGEGPTDPGTTEAGMG
jgi:hydroxymethylbilane synthase